MDKRLFLNSKSAFISEGSCDTEDWINDVANSAMIKYIQTENSYFNVTVFLIK